MSSIVKVDTIQENTSANGITVDGLNIKDSKLVTANSVVTANITDANVTLAKLAGDSVNATKIADNAISEEHLDVTAVTGHTAETSIADGDTILIHDASASALRKMTKANFVSGIGGTNTPCFMASKSGSQNADHNTATLLSFDNQVFDVGGVYDTSSYRYTPAFAGKSYIASGFWSYDAQVLIYLLEILLKKNGNTIVAAENRIGSSSEGKRTRAWINFSGIFEHDDNDYFEVYGVQGSSDSGANAILSGSSSNSVFHNYFTGFKIIE